MFTKVNRFTREISPPHNNCPVKGIKALSPESLQTGHSKGWNLTGNLMGSNRRVRKKGEKERGKSYQLSRFWGWLVIQSSVRKQLAVVLTQLVGHDNRLSINNSLYIVNMSCCSPLRGEQQQSWTLKAAFSMIVAAHGKDKFVQSCYVVFHETRQNKLKWFMFTEPLLGFNY